MKLLLILLWFPFATYAMEALTEKAEKNVVEQLLGKEKTGWHTLPTEAGKTVAQYILDGHPIVSYILSHHSLPKILKGHTDQVYSPVFNKRGDRLATLSNDQWLRLWYVQTGTGKKIKKYNLGNISCCGGTLLHLTNVSGRDEAVRGLYDIETGNLLYVLEGHKSNLNVSNFNHLGTRIITASSDCIKLWDALTGECLQTFVIPKEIASVSSFAFSPTGDKITVICAHSATTLTATIWDCSTGICLCTYNDFPTFDRTWNTLVTTSFSEKTAKIWDFKTGRCLHTLLNIRSVQLVWSDKVALVSENNTLIIWDIKANRCIKSVDGYTGEIAKEMLFVEGDKLVIHRETGRTSLWDLKTNTFIYTGECPHQRDGQVLLTNFKMSKMVTISPTDGLKIWDLTKNACIYTIPSCIDPILAFDDKVNKIVTISDDYTLSIWDISPLFDCQQFFESGDISLLQAIVLNAIYEIIIIRALVKKKHFRKPSLSSTLMIGVAEERVQEELAEGFKELVLDFNTFQHLEEHYQAMPQAIKEALDPFVKRTIKHS